MWTAIIDVLSKTFTCLNLKVFKMPETATNSLYAITNKIIYDCEYLFVCLIVFIATFNNISVIWAQSDAILAQAYNRLLCLLRNDMWLYIYITNDHR
jgi:hypothetical protein